jgi:hypothetical protein
MFKKFAEPLASIRAQPLQFAVWWIVANVVGLSGIWLPLWLDWYRGSSQGPSFAVLVASGSLATFSIVLLADGIATSLATKGGLNFTAAGIRGVAGACALLVVLLDSALIFAGLSPSKDDHPRIGFQIFLAIVAIALASYLYCFRSADWEKSVEQVKETEDREVKQLSEAANLKTSDGSGAKL